MCAGHGHRGLTPGGPLGGGRRGRGPADRFARCPRGPTVLLLQNTPRDTAGTPDPSQCAQRRPLAPTQGPRPGLARVFPEPCCGPGLFLLNAAPCPPFTGDSLTPPCPPGAPPSVTDAALQKPLARPPGRLSQRSQPVITLRPWICPLCWEGQHWGHWWCLNEVFTVNTFLSFVACSSCFFLSFFFFKIINHEEKENKRGDSTFKIINFNFQNFLFWKIGRWRYGH